LAIQGGEGHCVALELSPQPCEAILCQKQVRERRVTVSEDGIRLGLQRLTLHRQSGDIAGGIHSGRGEEHRHRSHGSQKAKAKAQNVSS
jgi:hypothetical protein